MRAATEALARVVPAAVLLALTACGSAADPPPVSSPAARRTVSGEWRPAAVPSAGDMAVMLAGEPAVSLRAAGRLVIGAGPGARAFDAELLLARSGAMRLRATDADGEILMISDGSRLWTRGRGVDEEADAWRAPESREGRPDAAISPFDLLAALLPAPWPDLQGAEGRVAVSVEPEGVWIALAMPSAGELPVVRRRALLGPDGVSRREAYDAGGALERVVEWVVPGRSIEIRRPREGTRVRLEIAVLERDPAVAVGGYRPRR